MDVKAFNAGATEIVRFPGAKATETVCIETKLKVVPWVNARSAMEIRNFKARNEMAMQYSRRCRIKEKQKRDGFWCVVIGTLYCVEILVTLFVL